MDTKQEKQSGKIDDGSITKTKQGTTYEIFDGRLSGAGERFIEVISRRPRSPAQKDTGDDT